MTMGQRLRQARLARGLTLRAVAASFGDAITRTSVNQWELEITHPVAEKIPELARILQVDAGWLVTGQGESGLTARREERTVGIPVPIVTTAELIAQQHAQDGPLVRTHYLASARAVAHRLQSRVLEPLIPPGAMIVIDPGASPDAGSLVAATLGGRLIFGRLDIEVVNDVETWSVLPTVPGMPRQQIHARALLGVISEFSIRLALADAQG